MRKSRNATSTLLPALALALLAAAVSAETPPRTSTALSAYLDLAAKSTALSAVVVVGEGDEILLEEAYGLADYELGVPLSPDHILRIGSLTKPVTAAAVLRFVERGEIELDASICRWLQDCPATWEPVTIHHLLSHSSGLPEYFGDLDSVPVAETGREVERVIAAFDAPPALDEPPGTEYTYRNFNYVLLGYVLERESGLPWEQVLVREELGPLDLDSLRYDDVFAIVEGRAHGYIRKDGVLRNIEYDDHSAYAAGGLRTRVRDLFRWFRALVGGKIVGPELLERSFTANLGDYGYGWAIRGYFGRSILSHTGGIDGFSSVLMYDRDADRTIVVLSNVESDPAILRACDLLWLLVERPTEADPEARGALEPRDRCGLPPRPD